jgi:hypothetical protein
MPAYEKSQWNAIFFIMFIIISVFYLHSLVLSVVFQVFISSASDVHKQAAVDRDQSMRLAFLALASVGGTTTNIDNNNNIDDPSRNHSSCTLDTSTTSKGQDAFVVDPTVIHETLQLLRPHYSALKLKILMDIIVPETDSIDRDDNKYNHDTRNSSISYDGTTSYRRIDIPPPLNGNKQMEYEVFRRRIRDALGCSIRATRTPTTVGLAVETFSVVVVVLNFIYVILLTSSIYDANWIQESEVIVASLITCLALLEVSIRYNPLNVTCHANPISRLNTVLDGTALLGGLLSFFGTLYWWGRCIISHSGGSRVLLTRIIFL